MAEKAPPPGPEIFIALVGAVGTDLDGVTAALRSSLADVGYESEVVRLSELLHQIDRWEGLANIAGEKERLEAHMQAGTEFREALQRGDAMVALSIGAIRDSRAAHWSGKDSAPAGKERGRKPVPRRAYILRSLKHPKEAETLRATYGPAFFLVAAYSPRESMQEFLAQRIARSEGRLVDDQHRHVARELSKKDEAEAGKRLGQNTRKTFPLADVFVDVRDEQKLRQAVGRFVQLIFGHPFRTPTRDEYGMFHAHAAAMRSADLGRQVGAVIATSSGDIVAVGTNEVPKAGGGLYWSDDQPPDPRDHARRFDTNDVMKREMLQDLIKRLRKHGWLRPEKTAEEAEALVKATLAKDETSPLHDAKLMNLIEFVRAVHAEMASLVDAARRGASVQDCTLYTSTFPCHDCAKHIVAAGIRRVVYIEPYPKSRAAEFYPDAVAVDSPDEPPPKVRFEPFVGIAPRQYMTLFMQGEGSRKGPDGYAVDWPPAVPLPRSEGMPLSYIPEETAQMDQMYEAMEKAGLSFVSDKGAGK